MRFAALLAVGTVMLAGVPVAEAGDGRMTGAEQATARRAAKFCSMVSNCNKSGVMACEQRPGPKIVCRGFANQVFGPPGEGDNTKCLARFVWLRGPEGNLDLTNDPHWSCGPR